MRIIVVGASGRIGSEVVSELSASHEIVRVGLKDGDVQCDYTDIRSIQKMYRAVGSFDALCVAAGGDGVFKPYGELEDDDYRVGFERKFLGQIKLVRFGAETINDNGSFTLSTGFLSHYPNPYSLAIGPFNSMVNTFAQNLAPFLARGIRINTVSPAPIVEPGEERRGVVTAAQTAKYFAEAVEGDFTGKVLRAWGGLPVPE